MKLNEIYKIADSIAPKALSDEYCERYAAYDNSGILVNVGEDIKKILFSLDLSFQAIDKAIEENVDLIITHHPAMYGSFDHARIDAEKFPERKLVQCLKNGISVISMHLNLDCAEGGIDETLMQGIQNASESGFVSESKIMHTLSSGGYGRVYPVCKTTLMALAEGIKETFATEKVQFYGEKEKEVCRVASFCGAGADEEAVAFAIKNGADTLISSDFKHHVLTFAVESGLSVIVMTHYASECYGFKKYYEKIRQRVEIPCIFHTDENLL